MCTEINYNFDVDARGKISKIRCPPGRYGLDIWLSPLVQFTALHKQVHGCIRQAAYQVNLSSTQAGFSGFQPSEPPMQQQQQQQQPPANQPPASEPQPPAPIPAEHQVAALAMTLQMYLWW